MSGTIELIKVAILLYIFLISNLIFLDLFLNINILHDMVNYMNGSYGLPAQLVMLTSKGCLNALKLIVCWLENTDDPDKIFATDRDVIACYWFVS
jgi:hypothetical protein